MNTKYFVLFEGRNSNENDMVTTFRKLERAMGKFHASKYAYAVLNEYDGTRDDTMANYRDTICEKGA